MKKSFLTSFVLLGLAITAISCKGDKKNETTASEAQEAAAASEVSVKYAAVPAESVIEWKGFKPTGTHMGTVSVEAGTLSLSNGVIDSGSFIIDMNSIAVTDLESGNGKENLEAHLKGTVEGKEGDFFNVNEHPSAAFEITGFEAGDQPKLTGNLTLKGVKKNVSFPVTVTENGDEILLTSEPFTIDRTQWGVNYGSKSIFDNLGDKFINDDIELKINIKAKKA